MMDGDWAVRSACCQYAATERLRTKPGREPGRQTAAYLVRISLPSAVSRSR